MGKAAAKQKTTITEPSAQQYLAALEIKQRFIGDALNLGWRLAVTFIVPVLIGVGLDSHFHSKPSYTLGGIFIAIAASVAVIRQTVKEVNEDLVKPTKKRKKNV